ncbi:bifunctional GrpB family protein/GNAT family N-acetyltransferase [Mycolicibacterium mucogenicum]|uniref:GNAT family N-acetyltransferase n=1 Tax=Mycolicibacterium mucogenicum DSM 44124 TaxID=1226753 RepID=A0A8H2PFC5_MYCMU|nr:bifunctional GrpB family protein/GNAT family N-acetyltransferase [Mycolicibacterium mucogenicum]QPG71263.1 GNAT family N-acetyltransferase [Mycolicibacterium mucogenicum DSM 44124]
MGDAPVQVTQYNAAWADRFATQRDQLEVILQPWLYGPVEHVGSTAVPGSAAKPIVDIAAPIRSLVEARRAIPVLERSGWLYWPSDPNSAWRLWLLRPRPDTRTHHLYLIQHDDPHLRELTAFRDLLRTDALARQAYAALKEQLAQQYRTDREAYTSAKTDFVTELLKQAAIEMQPRPNASRDAAKGDQIKVLAAPSNAADDAAVRLLLALATGGGQPRIAEAVLQYRNDSGAKLFLATLGNETVGLVGYKVVAGAMVVLLHLAVASHVRRMGIGRRLLVKVRRTAPPELPVVAETDREAVQFYRATGFTVTSLGEKYPGVERYRAELGRATRADDRDWR